MLNVVDCHAEGESGKVVVGGVGDVSGHTMFDKRGYLQQNLDQLRELLLFEPRGAVWHNANIILAGPATRKRRWDTSSSNPPSTR